ncbi:hypothetical protein RYX36_016482, partial [Vicia faba]
NYYNYINVHVPTACVILISLFVLQYCGTHKIGFMFSLIIDVWLLFVGVLGVYNIIHWDIEILSKISPLYLIKFMRNLDVSRWRLLGSDILCAAGSEAMFAGLGHFSKKSIK